MQGGSLVAKSKAESDGAESDGAELDETPHAVLPWQTALSYAPNAVLRKSPYRSISLLNHLLVDGSEFGTLPPCNRSLPIPGNRR